MLSSGADAQEELGGGVKIVLAACEAFGRSDGHTQLSNPHTTIVITTSLGGISWLPENLLLTYNATRLKSNKIRCVFHKKAIKWITVFVFKVRGKVNCAY